MNICETWLVYRQYLVNFQARTPNVKVTVRHSRKCGQRYNLQMAWYSLSISSIHLTYFIHRDNKPRHL